MGCYALRITQCTLYLLVSDESDLFNLLNRFVVIYFDDILVFNELLSNHLAHLCIVLQHLCDKCFCAKLQKCAFLLQSVEYLGHIVSACSVCVDPARLEAIRQWPVPICIKYVQQFLSLCSYFNKYVHHFAWLATPLSDLFRRGTVWYWPSVEQSAFD